MPLQVCYALTSTGEDAYADMTFLSATALRRVERDVTITLVADEMTEPLLTQKNNRLVKLVDKIVRVETGQPSAQLRSRFLKTTLRRNTEGDFVFLDADALPIGSFRSILAAAGSFAAANDLSAKDPKPGFPSWMKPYYEKLGWPCPTPHYINSGVTLWRDDATARKLGDEWHRRWLEFTKLGRHFDQPALNSALHALNVPMTVLPPSYNAMIDVSPWLCRGAMIFHYYVSTADGLPGPATLLRHLLDHLHHTGEFDTEAFERCRAAPDAWTQPTDCFQRQLATKHYLRAAGILARRAGNKIGLGRHANADTKPAATPERGAR